MDQGWTGGGMRKSHEVVPVPPPPPAYWGFRTGFRDCVKRELILNLETPVHSAVCSVTTDGGSAR